MSTHAPKRLPWLDALRGIAALVVLLHHVLVFFTTLLRQTLGVAATRALYVIGDRHGEAVLTFFLLSGFSIRLSIEGRGLGTRADVNHYLYRRFRRILPLYWLALLVSALAAVIAPVSNDSFTLATLLGNLLFLQSSAGVPGHWFAPFAANGPLWSLSFEMAYYLAFPIFYRLVEGRTRRLLVAFGLSLAAVTLNKLWPNPLAQFGGLFVAWYLGVELAEAHLGTPGGAPVWCFGLFALVLFAAHLGSGSQQLLALAKGALLAQLALIAGRLPQVPSAALRPFVWIGGFSYALYLLHYPILRVTAAVLEPGSSAEIAALVLLCMAVAYAAERILTRSRHAYLERAYLGHDR